jgi:peptidoglycan/LPS O-acetylase OafA/YrhL
MKSITNDGAVGEPRHYSALDGMRGIVAVSVLLYHAGHWRGMPFLATNSGLAVDFFFCLSGFVLSYAYDARLSRDMSVARFMVIRLRRLMPLLVFATLVSATFVVLRSAVKHEPIPPSEIAWAALLGALNLPHFTPSSAIGGPQIFPLNGPQYTLFFEIVVNAFWALSSHFRGLRFAAAVSAIALVGVAVPGTFGGDVPASFLTGFPRVFAAFYLGVLAFQIDRRIGTAAPSTALFWTCLVGTLGMFYFPVEAPFWLNLCWIGLVAPLLVYSGARVQLGPRMTRVATSLGALSYPLYILHYPVFCWVNGTYRFIFGHPNALAECALLLVSAVALSFAALHYLDLPLRRALSSSTANRVRPAARIARG